MSCSTSTRIITDVFTEALRKDLIKMTTDLVTCLPATLGTFDRQRINSIYTLYLQHTHLHQCFQVRWHVCTINSNMDTCANGMVCTDVASEPPNYESCGPSPPAYPVFIDRQADLHHTRQTHRNIWAAIHDVEARELITPDSEESASTYSQPSGWSRREVMFLIAILVVVTTATVVGALLDFRS